MNNPIQLQSLYKIQYGMYIITTIFENKMNGQIATTLFQVTNEPMQVAVCLSKNTYTCELLSKSKIFGASILEQNTPIKFIGTYGYRCGKDCDKFCECHYETGATGVPLITDHTLAILEANVNNIFDVGTHSIFVGELKSSKIIKEGAAMTYEYYHTIVKGKSPKNAPTYQKSQ